MLRFLKNLLDARKLKLMKNSLYKEDKMYAHIVLDDGRMTKQRVVAESVFPKAPFKKTTVVVEGEDRKFHIIREKDIIENYSAERRYRRLFKELKEKNQYIKEHSYIYEEVGYY